MDLGDIVPDVELSMLSSVALYGKQFERLANTKFASRVVSGSSTSQFLSYAKFHSCASNCVSMFRERTSGNADGQTSAHPKGIFCFQCKNVVKRC